MIAEFTAKTTNSEKAISFLSLMFCSINKLQSHMLFTCKNFMVSDFTWKKNFAAENSGGLFIYCGIFDSTILYHKW